jgi:hypothetical protein
LILETVPDELKNNLHFMVVGLSILQCQLRMMSVKPGVRALTSENPLFHQGTRTLAKVIRIIVFGTLEFDQRLAVIGDYLLKNRNLNHHRNSEH